MNISFVTDQWPGEPDILTEVKDQVLIIRDLEGKHLQEFTPPKDGWTHQRLMELSAKHDYLHGANGYLGRSWVGSTEV